MGASDSEPLTEVLESFGFAWSYFTTLFSCESELDANEPIDELLHELTVAVLGDIGFMPFPVARPSKRMLGDKAYDSADIREELTQGPAHATVASAGALFHRLFVHLGHVIPVDEMIEERRRLVGNESEARHA